MKDKERRAIFIHCVGTKVQDIFDMLEETGEDLETAGKKLQEYFEPKKHQLYNIYQFQQTVQEQDELYDNLAARSCEFLQGWRDIEIQL